MACRVAPCCQSHVHTYRVRACDGCEIPGEWGKEKDLGQMDGSPDAMMGDTVDVYAAIDPNEGSVQSATMG